MDLHKFTARVLLVLVTCLPVVLSVHQLLVLDKLPDNYESSRTQVHRLTLRSDLPGVIEFVESDKFHIDVNLTGDTVPDLTRVHYDYQSYEGGFLLQLYSQPEAPPPSVVPALLYTLLAVTLLSLVGSSTAVILWSRRQHQPTKPTTTTDCSAPLLDAAVNQVNQNCKQQNNMAECSSDEDETPRYTYPAHKSIDSIDKLPSVSRSSLDIENKVDKPRAATLYTRDSIPDVVSRQNRGYATMDRPQNKVYSSGTVYATVCKDRNRLGPPEDHDQSHQEGDSAGSESSRSSGFRTASTVLSDASQRLTDSDASSVASYQRDQRMYGPARFYPRNHKLPENIVENDARFEDEAYGTLHQGLTSSRTTPNTNKRRVCFQEPAISIKSGYLSPSLHVLFCLSIILTCAVSSSPDPVQAHIKVYAPRNFLLSYSEIFTRPHTKVLDPKRELRHFVVEDAYLKFVSLNLCGDKACKQGCDPRTGDCVCRTGYVLRNLVECEDDDECSMPIVCEDHSTCSNFMGYYKCLCDEGFYLNDTTTKCHDCLAPCVPGSYQVSPCQKGSPKLCQECRKTCPIGEYISLNCTPTADITCKACSPRCPQGQFEFVPCEGHFNRECKDLAELGLPYVSNNVIYENRKVVKEATSHVDHQVPNRGPLSRTYTLSRESGFVVNVTVREANLAPLFEAVDHEPSNDNEGFTGNTMIRTSYCPYPVPEKYQLNVKVHEHVTGRAVFYNCTQELSQGRRCLYPTGYSLNPREPCQTYSLFAELPKLNPQGWSILCSQPGGRLTKTFELDQLLDKMSTHFYYNTYGCSSQRTDCDRCLVEQAKDMATFGSSHKCNVTADEADNGQSPRLAYCYSCYSKRNCAKLCEVYTNPECRKIRCITSPLAEFELVPVWPSRPSLFYCHVRPVPAYIIYELQYSVLFNGRVVNDRIVTVSRRYVDQHAKQASERHGFLRVVYGSNIQGTPTMIEGDLSINNFKTGYFQANGAGLNRLQAGTLSVRPRTPFKVSTKVWKSADCDSGLLEHLVMADTAQTGSLFDQLFRSERGLLVKVNEKFTFQVFNDSASTSSLPFLYLEIPRNESILSSVYDSSSVKDDGSLSAAITRDNNQWRVTVQGELVRCPGWFNLRVFDPVYKDVPLFDYDFGVSCPEKFSVEFHLPVKGPDTTEKRLIGYITDSFRTIKMTIVRPQPSLSQETKGSTIVYPVGGEVDVSIFTPLLAVLLVITAFLLLLLMCGVATDTNKSNRAAVDRVESQHLVFVVVLVTFKTAYSVALTFTVLLLLVRHVSRDPLATLTQFDKFTSTVGNWQKKEVDSVHQVVLEEIRRQNDQANETKRICELKLQQLQNSVEQMKLSMSAKKEDEELITNLAMDYTKQMLQNFTQKVEKFKEDFSSYAKSAVDKLTKNMVQTETSLQSNKWLSGAKTIYDAVQTKRRLQGQSSQNTKLFLDWVGLRQQLERITTDLSVKTHPVPKLEDILSLQTPKIKSRPSYLQHIEDVKLPRNQWTYYRMEPDKPEAMPPSGQEQNHSTKVPGFSWVGVLIALVILDVFWFVHRMSITYVTARNLLYGYPNFIPRNRNNHTDTDGEVESRLSRWFGKLHHGIFWLLRTDFIPKLAAVVVTGTVLYIVVTVASKVLTIRAINSLGYMGALVAPVETSYELAKTRIKTNAYRINKFEYPFYEELVNVRTKRYQLILYMYAHVRDSVQALHRAEVCEWKRLLDPSVVCDCPTTQVPRLTFEGCELAPVLLQPFERKDIIESRRRLSKDLLPYLNAGRSLVRDVCHLVALFVAVLVLVDTLGNVCWIYLKKFNMLRIKPLVEVDLKG